LSKVSGLIEGLTDHFLHQLFSERREKGDFLDQLKSFGRLLRRLRGHTPLTTVAAQSQLDADYLAKVEAGEVPVDLPTARHILRSGLTLSRKDTNRLLLGLQLYDLGLKDNEIRQLVIAVIRKELPRSVQDEIRQLYRRISGV
jgi:hypothetical protein